LISHTYLGISDFPRAMAFYGPVLAALGLTLKFSDAQGLWAGWHAPPATRPLFLIGRPFDGEAARPGNGAMIALLAADRNSVDRAHALALNLGGQCEGPPGLRPQYHPHYYGAYFRDPDGNKLCICCHHPA
jgi:catechol 2,3-dioxygenase-like lactoylglutathione lyase family enzyme